MAANSAPNMENLIQTMFNVHGVAMQHAQTIKFETFSKYTVTITCRNNWLYMTITNTALHGEHVTVDIDRTVRPWLFLPHELGHIMRPKSSQTLPAWLEEMAETLKREGFETPRKTFYTGSYDYDNPYHPAVAGMLRFFNSLKWW